MMSSFLQQDPEKRPSAKKSLQLDVFKGLVNSDESSMNNTKISGKDSTIEEEEIKI